MVRSAIWLTNVILKGSVTTVTNQAMCNLNVLCQELLSTSNVTTVVRLDMSRVNVPYSVVSTVTKLVTFLENVLNQERERWATKVSLVTDVVVQTMSLETVCKTILSVIPVVDLVIYLETVQMVQMKRSATTVTKLAIFPENAQLCN